MVKSIATKNNHIYKWHKQKHIIGSGDFAKVKSNIWRNGQKPSALFFTLHSLLALFIMPSLLHYSLLALLYLLLTLSQVVFPPLVLLYQFLGSVGISVRVKDLIEAWVSLTVVQETDELIYRHRLGGLAGNVTLASAVEHDNAHLNGIGNFTIIVTQGPCGNTKTPLRLN